ncbi:MAG: glycerophosphodiester phosphodiesterase family protein [Gammaproteobacteria bacterium]
MLSREMLADHLVAHRGYPARLPENTLPSIEAAVQAGARYIEVDVQLSRDGEVILFHDRDLHRLCGQAGAVHDYDWQELHTFHVHSNTETADTSGPIPLPRLHEVVTLLQQYPDVTLFIELKRISLEQFGIDAVVQRVLSQLQPVANQAVIISYGLTALQRVRQTGDYPIGVVIDDWSERDQPAIRHLKPEYLFCDLASLPHEGALDCEDCKLVLFECTDPQQAISLLQRGATLIETFAIGEMLSGMTASGASLE